ncbi:Transposase IS116/IS110/IS902 family protein [compost metagenome]
MGLPEVGLVKSISGIGDEIAAVIVAEIGDVRKFREAKQLVAFAGLDLGISARGNSRRRAAELPNDFDARYI